MRNLVIVRARHTLLLYRVLDNCGRAREEYQTRRRRSRGRQIDHLHVGQHSSTHGSASLVASIVLTRLVCTTYVRIPCTMHKRIASRWPPLTRHFTDFSIYSSGVPSVSCLHQQLLPPTAVSSVQYGRVSG